MAKGACKGLPKFNQGAHLASSGQAKEGLEAKEQDKGSRKGQSTEHTRKNTTNRAFCIYVIKGFRKETARGGKRGLQGALEVQKNGTSGVLRTSK